MDLKQIKRGRALHWPTKMTDPSNRFRCEAGSIIDLDAPLERDLFCAGQEYKLQDAPEGTSAKEVAEIEFPPARRMVLDERERLAAEGENDDGAGDAVLDGEPDDPELDIKDPVEPTKPAKKPGPAPIKNLSGEAQTEADAEEKSKLDAETKAAEADADAKKAEADKKSGGKKKG